MYPPLSRNILRKSLPFCRLADGSISSMTHSRLATSCRVKRSSFCNSLTLPPDSRSSICRYGMFAGSERLERLFVDRPRRHDPQHKAGVLLDTFERGHAQQRLAAPGRDFQADVRDRLAGRCGAGDVVRDFGGAVVILNRWEERFALSGFSRRKEDSFSVLREHQHRSLSSAFAAFSHFSRASLSASSQRSSWSRVFCW